MQRVKIKEIEGNHFETFRDYLKNHLSENGENNFFFLPVTKEQFKFNQELEDKFRLGLSKEFGQRDWRKLWVAVNEEERIVGHIDIRSRNEPNTEHRVLLGMGTDREFRNLKVGQQLLNFVIEYCKTNSKVSWIDMDVMANNIPAIKLYEKMEFQLVSTIRDKFRIQNQSYDSLSMTLDVQS